MSSNVWVVGVNGEALVKTPDEHDLIECDATRVLWMHENVTTFLNVMQETEPFMDEQLRLLLREEVAATIDHPAKAQLITMAPDLAILLSVQQFESLQGSLRAALGQGVLDIDGYDKDRFDELTHVRVSGDFVAILD